MFIQSKSPKLTGVIAFNIAYLAAFITGAVIVENYVFFYQAGILTALIFALYLAHRNVCYSSSLLWSLSFWGLFHLAGNLLYFPLAGVFSSSHPAETTVLNQTWIIADRLRYDHLVHCYGFALTTWLMWQSLCQIIHRRYQRRLLPTFGLLLLCATSSMGYGAVNETVEFVSNICFPHTDMAASAQTSWDLIANMTGAAIASVWIRLCHL